MARIPRLLIKGEKAIYHVISRTALQGLPMEACHKDYLFNLIRMLGRIYFAEVFGVTIMGNHFHLLVRMLPGDGVRDDDIVSRFDELYHGKRVLMPGQIEYYRRKWENLSEFVKDIKQTFTKYYNKVTGRKGYFWSDRYKSLIVQHGEPLIHCLAYIDLNPVRAGIVKRPEHYRWSGFAYHFQRGNADGFLSLDFGSEEFNVVDNKEKIRRYRRYVYEAGAVHREKSAFIDSHTMDKERKRGYEMQRYERFQLRTRFFTESGILGSKEFVESHFRLFKHVFKTDNDRKAMKIKGLQGIYSMKRLE